MTPEHSKSFSVNFTRKGSFVYGLGKRAYDIHSGVVLLENAGCERMVSHPNPVKDECTVLELEDNFLWEEVRRFGGNYGQSIKSIARPGFSVSILRTTPTLDYLHLSILKSAGGESSEPALRMEDLLVALIQEVCASLVGTPVANQQPPLDRRMKDRHLAMIERAKGFIVANFRCDLSLSEIARHAHVSMFHFSRLFRHFTSSSPHQFLIDVRLKHAELLLRNTSLSVTEVCFDSGFSSLEHFITTFTHRYCVSPSRYRHRK